MKNLIGFLTVVGFYMSVSIAMAAEPTAKLVATDIPTGDVLSNIILVGLAMIGLVLAKFGIKAAKSMIS